MLWEFHLSFFKRYKKFKISAHHSGNQTKSHSLEKTYLPHIYLIKSFSLGHTKNFYNSWIKRQPHFKKPSKTQTFQKIKYTMANNCMKKWSNEYSSRNCKVKPHNELPQHSNQCAQIQRLTKLNVDKNIKDYKLSYIVDRSKEELALWKMPGNSF